MQMCSNAEVSELVSQVDAKWGSALESIEGIRTCLSDALVEMGSASDREGDLEQFERLVLLGESACAPHTISHFLSSKLGGSWHLCSTDSAERGLERTLG